MSALSPCKLRAIINLLSDPMQAGAAAHILAQEAERRGVLVADLIAEALAPPAAETPAPDPSDSIDVAIGRRIDGDTYGLQAEVHYETDRAWLIASPTGGPEVWLPKSRVERHGEDPVGRAIFILPIWLARKKGFLQ
jgi:hypothetical protein